MRPLLCALAILGLLGTGCSRSGPGSAEAPSPPADSTAAPSPAEPPVLALTGLVADDPEVLERPVLAVKVDNAPAARPQQGLEAADVVITELVEGGTTRFLALYHSTDPGEVGPVRSGREVDADLLPGFEPVVALSGAAKAAYRIMHEAGLLTFEEGEAGGAFFRAPGRRAPHNLFATAATLWQAGTDQPAASAPWPFAKDAPAGGRRAATAALTFSPASSVRWTWNRRASVWLREQDGGPQMTADDERISAHNVVVARVVVSPGRRTDVAGNPTVDIKVVGKGKAVVLRDGKAYRARWRKQKPGADFEWLTRDGKPLPLAPGQTWIELVPTSGAVSIERPGNDG